MGPVTYEVHHPEEAKVMMAWAVDEDEEMEVYVKAWQQQQEVPLDHLEESQMGQLQRVFADFPTLFQQSPGHTEVLEHKICLKDSTPILETLPGSRMPGAGAERRGSTDEGLGGD